MMRVLVLTSTFLFALSATAATIVSPNRQAPQQRGSQFSQPDSSHSANNDANTNTNSDTDASTRPPNDQERQQGQEPPQLVVFNIVCRNEAMDSRSLRCYSASRFQKYVTARGEEIEDDSDHPFNPKFQVECNGETIFNNGAHRFTDRQGTRIQIQTGPYPAIVIPPNSLKAGHRQVSSLLELRDTALKGSCHIYTGNP